MRLSWKGLTALLVEEEIQCKAGNINPFLEIWEIELCIGGTKDGGVN
ncbi:hypothetical protein KIS4809_5689 [Bacillus sp. ZZV12-4809]|nr:hypothetical protein KIS4809_5689 [Bacillus sp. ZZV12-4809]